MLYSLPDEIDITILQELQRNSRIPNSELAGKVGLSASACLSRTNKLRELGIIKHFVTAVDRLKVGLPVLLFTFVTLSPHNRKMADAFVERIKEMDQVLECYHITGRFDFLLKIVAPDISTYRDYIIDELVEIPGVEKVETLVVLKEEKERFSLPLDNMKLKERDE